MLLEPIMSSSAAELKAKARELLPPPIAQSVEASIDAELAERARNQHSGPSARPSSIWTAYLGDEFYGTLPTGRFTGRPTVQWNGMDSFIFLEDTATPFTYQTASARLIRPRTIITDGGSTPRFLHALKNFSPRGYGPAYVIHDWLFVAHRKSLKPDHDWRFEDTATALAESIKTLMEIGFVAADGNTVKLDKAEDTLYLIYKAVLTPIAHDFWNAP
jgi:hypothetical protein